MSILAIVLLLVVLAVVFPRAGAYNAGWGYAPFSIGGVLLVILVIWLLFGGGGFNFHLR